MDLTVEADRLFRSGSYRQALDRYQSLAKQSKTAALDFERRLRISICLAHLDRHEEAREAVQSLVSEAAGSLWHARGLHWLAYLHVRNYALELGREALEAARVLYPGLRGEEDTRMEEIRLNFDLLSVLISRASMGSYNHDSKVTDHPARSFAPGEAYSPEWPIPTRIRFLFHQIRELAGADTDLADAVLSAGLAQAFWLQGAQHRPWVWLEQLSAPQRYPERELDPHALLAECLARFPGTFREPEVWLARGSIAAADGDLVAAETSFQQLLDRFPSAEEARTARDHLAAIRVPRLWMSAVTLTAAGTPARVRLWSRNLHSVELRLHRFDLERAWTDVSGSAPPDDRFECFAPFGGLLGSWAQVRSYLTPAGEPWTVPVSISHQHWWHHQELEVPLPEAGAWILEARSGDLRAAVLLIPTLHTLLARTGEGSPRLHLVDSRTGEPVSGAQLHLRFARSGWRCGERVKDDYRATHTTGETGWVELPPQGTVGYFAAIARIGDQYTLLPDQCVRSGYEPATQLAFGTVDRAACRPGETLHFRWLVMRKAGKRWRPASNLSLRVELDPCGRGPRLRCRVRTNEFGSATGSFNLSPQAQPGFHWLRVSGGEVYGHPVAVQIDEFRLPDAELAVTTPRGRVRAGSTVPVQIWGRYLSGEPFAGAEVAYAVRVTDYPAAFRCLVDHLPRSMWKGGAWKDSGTTVLDAAGRAEIKVATEPEEEGARHGMRLYRIDVRIEASGDRPIKGACLFEVVAEGPLTHLRTEPAYARPGEEVTISISPVPPSAGRLSIRRAGNPGETVEVANLPVDGNGAREGTARWVPEASGGYELFYLPDGAEAEACGTPFWVHAGEDVDTPSGPLQLIPRQEEWKQGDTLRALVVAPEPGCTLLVRHESATTLRREEWVHLTGRTHEIICPLNDEDVPTTYLFVRTVLRGEVLEQRSMLRVTPVKSLVHVAVMLNPPESKSRNQARPGEGAELRVETRDWRGEPVDAEVSLGVRHAGVDSILPLVGEVQETFFPEPCSNVETHSGLGCALRPYATTGVWAREVEYAWRMPKLPDPVGFGIGLGFGFVRPWECSVKIDYERLISHRRALPPKAAMPDGLAEAESFGCGLADISSPHPSDLPPEPDPGAIRLRGDFRSLACWEGALRTGPSGSALALFQWPDDLTEWRARAVAVTRAGEVGQADVSFHATLPLLLRPRCPRFLVAGDQAVLSTHVHSSHPEPLDLTLTLELDHPHVALLGLDDPLDLGRPEVPVRLAPGESVRVDWRVEARAPGPLRVRITAAGQRVGDAVELEVPVYVRGAVRTESLAGELREGMDTVRHSLSLPALRPRGATRLVVRAAPSVLGVLAGALRSLRGYPYAGAEESLSAVWTAALAHRMLGGKKRPAPPTPGVSPPCTGRTPYTPLTGMGGNGEAPLELMPGPADLDRAAQLAYRHLRKAQQPDGGWRWWSGRGSDPAVTLALYRGIHSLDAAGCRCPAGLRQRARRYLESLLNPDTPLPTLAEVVYLLSDAWLSRITLRHWATATLFPQRERLDAGRRAQLALALHRLGQRRPALQVIEELEQDARVDPAHGWGWWARGRASFDGSPEAIEQTAWVLRALVQLRPASPLLDPAARWLVQSRRGVAWRSTRETTTVIESLLQYAALRRETEPGHELRVRANGEPIGTLDFRGASHSAEQVLEVPEDLLSGGSVQLELERVGPGVAYYSAVLTSFTEEVAGATSNAGLSLTRRFFRLDAAAFDGELDVTAEKPEADRPNPYLSHDPSLTEPETPRPASGDPSGDRRRLLAAGELVRVGDLLEVELELHTERPLEYVLVEDIRPPGCEPIETLSGPGWSRGCHHREVRDDRVAFFLDRAARGATLLSYRLQVELAGRFHVLPAQAFAMYEPEIHALSEAHRLEIR